MNDHIDNDMMKYVNKLHKNENHEQIEKPKQTNLISRLGRLIGLDIKIEGWD